MSRPPEMTWRSFSRTVRFVLILIIAACGLSLAARVGMPEIVDNPALNSTWTGICVWLLSFLIAWRFSR